MTSTDTVSVNFDSIPSELKELDQWVLWEYRGNREGAKPTKIPIQTDTTRAATNDVSTWTNFDAAKQALLDGIGRGLGFVFTAEDQMLGIDLDGCRNPTTGELEGWAEMIVNQLSSYTEISPSGAGIHIVVKADIPELTGRRIPFEMYSTGRYFTVTGDLYSDAYPKVNERTKEAVSLYETHFTLTGEKKVTAPITPSIPEISPSGLTDDEVIAHCTPDRFPGFRKLYFEGDISEYGNDDSRADQALCWILSCITADLDQIDRIMRRSALLAKPDRKKKWDSKRVDSTYGKNTIKMALDWEPDSVAKPSTKSTDLLVVSLSDIEPEPVDWLMDGWSPYGKVSLIAGYPGGGKTFAALDIAGAVANGSELPNGQKATKGKVIYISGEDAPEDTLVPRLISLGHDRSNIDTISLSSLVEQSFELDKDHEGLGLILKEGGYRLLVIDPVNSLVPGIDVNRAGDVRKFMTPLAKIAHDLGMAIVGLLHFNKSTNFGNEIDLVSGSRDIAAAARAIHFIIQDENDSKIRNLLPVKMNLAGHPNGLTFSISDNGIEWNGETSSTIAGFLNADKPQNKRDSAKKFLQLLLAEGELNSDFVVRAAIAAGHSKKTLQRAREELPIAIITHSNEGKHGGKVTSWALENGQVTS